MFTVQQTPTQNSDPLFPAPIVPISANTAFADIANKKAPESPLEKWLHQVLQDASNGKCSEILQNASALENASALTKKLGAGNAKFLIHQCRKVTGFYLKNEWSNIAETLDREHANMYRPSKFDPTLVSADFIKSLETPKTRSWCSLALKVATVAVVILGVAAIAFLNAGNPTEARMDSFHPTMEEYMHDCRELGGRSTIKENAFKCSIMGLSWRPETFHKINSATIKQSRSRSTLDPKDYEGIKNLDADLLYLPTACAPDSKNQPATEEDWAKKVLGVSTCEEGRKAYRKFTLRLHPDKLKMDPQLTPLFHCVAEANSALKNSCSETHSKEERYSTDRSRKIGERRDKYLSAAEPGNPRVYENSLAIEINEETQGFSKTNMEGYSVIFEHAKSYFEKQAGLEPIPEGTVV